MSVTSPPYYQHGDIECKDAIHSMLGHSAFLGYCTGNIVKYIWRYGEKGGVDDLEKAKVYLEWTIDLLKTLNT